LVTAKKRRNIPIEVVMFDVVEKLVAALVAANVGRGTAVPPVACGDPVGE
jgi:hypothetical protein